MIETLPAGQRHAGARVDRRRLRLQKLLGRDIITALGSVGATWMRFRFCFAVLVLSTGVATAQTYSCDQRQARAELKRLTDDATILSTDEFTPSITVVVADRAWKRLDIDGKTALAKTVRCALAGPDIGMRWTILIRSTTSDLLAVFSDDALTIK